MIAKGSTRALTLSTTAFAFAFALWGMISPLGKTLQKEMRLTEQQTWLMIALPVLLGAIGRIPIGMLAERYGGRLVFGILLCVVSVPAFMLSQAHTYQDLLAWGLVLGIAGTSFAVGVSFTSRWFPPEKQGFALGIYGAGNIGQSVALYGIPLLAGILGGWRVTYQVFALAALVYGIVFLTLAVDAPAKAAPKSFGAMMAVLAQNPMAWLLSLFYFVTFGGFVALSIGLPKLLQELFHLTKEDAGLRVAGFVLLATAMRPIGGTLSDRIGGARLLGFVFAGAGILALGMTFVSIVPFTIGALGVAACIGLGNGGVFKLVPQFFPKDTGTVTGLVGAMGGLGGFFPPLVLGIIKTQTGSYALGFILLSVFCFVCLILNQVILIGKKQSSPGETAGSASGFTPAPAGPKA